MLMFLKAVGEAVVAKALKVASEFVPFGDKLYDIGADVIDRYRKAGREAKVAADAQAAISAKMEVIREDAKQIAREVAAGESQEVIDLVEAYLTQVPASITQSLKRADDPTGTTLPPGFAVSSAEDVARMLPPRVPRFRPTMPVPGKAGWTLDRLLGVGGFGEVWYARHDRMASLAGAIKFCFGQTGRDLIHEADLIDRVMQAGTHPNIVPLKDVHLDGDAPWIMFEYVGGGTLTDWIHALAGKSNEERLPQVLSAIKQLADAVAFFHALDRPLVHRDLKPSNILLDRATKKLRITDFGIGAVAARETNRQESRGQGTRGGRLLSYLYGSHTPIYSSPQQKAGGAPDPRDDVHALGVIAYQMLTGKLDGGPGTGATRALKRMGVADDVAELLLRCASEELEDRPKHAGELLAELNQLATQVPLSSQRPQGAGPAVEAPTGRRDDAAVVVPAKPVVMPKPEPVTPLVPAVVPPPPPAPPFRKAGERMEIALPGGVRMEFAWCPPGTFLMGSENGDLDEKPVREVRLTNGFFMGIHPVTQAQYEAVMGTKSSHFKGETRPVETVSWEEAVKFCGTMKQKIGSEVRLPTEAEWEYACRASTDTEYCSGNDETALKAVGWYSGNAGGETHPVGQLKPNLWGLYDCHGNVWEWCADWKDFYLRGAEVDPIGPQTGSVRVDRGGSWSSAAPFCHSSYRNFSTPGGRYSDVGFRVAADESALSPTG